MRKSRFIPIGLGAISIAALGVSSAFEFAPQLVWNASASAPIGLYRIEKRLPEIDEYVLVKPEDALETFMVERGYLPPEIPLLKRVAALAGDEICCENDRIFVNNIHVANALFVDSAGRKMPIWRGCFSLRKDEVFLLNAPEKSLDGRYFGATSGSQIIGIARPVWVKADTPK
jgi:conjugative transfer signal peptidase TraF